MTKVIQKKNIKPNTNSLADLKMQLIKKLHLNI